MSARVHTRFSLDSTSVATRPHSTTSSPRNYLPHRLAAVEVSLIFHYLDHPSAWSLLRCCSSLRQIALSPFVWRHAPSIEIEQSQIDDAARNEIIRSGQVPLRVMWQGEHPASIAEEIDRMGRLANLRELHCTERRGLDDQSLALLVAQPSLAKSISKIWLGGFHNHVTSTGLSTLCHGLTQLTAISLDHIREAEVHEAHDGAAGGADEAPVDAHENDAPDAGAPDELMSSLSAARELTSLQITRWMAEELTPHSLHCISRCSLQSLFLENLEAFSSSILREFFSSAVFHGLKHLTLSYVQFKQTETFLALFEEGSEGAASYYSPRKGLFDQMVCLETLDLQRCRDCHRVVSQIVLIPNLKVVTIRGMLDSWGVELPKRDELLTLIRGSASLERVTLFVHTATPEHLDNYRAQVSAVDKIDFRDGNTEMNEIKF
jgi:hypothetical protein